MKQLSIVFVAASILLACNNEKKTDEKTVDDMKEKKEMPAISYPYKAEYSSDFVFGDVNHSKMVLDLFKMWEDGKVDDMRPLLADSVSIDFPDGFKFNNTADSMIKFAKEYRSTLSSVKTKVEGWMPVHSNDMKDDYVLVWSMDYITDKSGKLDSSRTHAYFLIKDNKVRSWSEYSQKMAPPTPTPPKKK
jgi:hypothetical protein